MPNTQQSIILVGVLLVVAMAAYPPWMYVDDDKVTHLMGYAPIWQPPTQHQTDTANILGIKLQLDVHTQTANTIDLVRLLMQIAIMGAVAAGAVFLLKRSPTA